MPKIERDGIELYFEMAGEGPPLLIHHGFMQNLEHQYHWRSLLPTYQLIFIDARGHGKSSKPHHPAAYTLSERTLDVVFLLDHLGIEKSHFMGYSMGGWVGLGLAAAYPQRFYGIIAGGIGPEALSPESSRYWREPMMEALQEGMEMYCQRIEAIEGRVMDEEERAQYLALDYAAMIACLAVEEEPDFRSSLINSPVDLLIFVGELDSHYDSAKELCAELPQAQFLSIPGRDHSQAGEPQAFLLAEISRFLENHHP